MDKQKKGNCLVTSLKILGAFLLLPIILALGWLAGIVWLIFFRKRLDDQPEKKRKYTLLVSILSAFSFLLMVASVSSPSGNSANPDTAPSEEVLSIIDESESFDPASEIIENAEYNEINASDSEDIESNESIEDISAEESSETSSESTIDNQDQEQSTEAVPDVPDEEPPADTISDVQASEPSSVPVSDAEYGAGEMPSDPPSAEAIQETQNQSIMVWIPKSGTKYHRNSSCSGMKSPSQVTKEEAEALGYSPCSKCY